MRYHNWYSTALVVLPTISGIGFALVLYASTPIRYVIRKYVEQRMKTNPDYAAGPILTFVYEKAALLAITAFMVAIMMAVVIFLNS